MSKEFLYTLLDSMSVSGHEIPLQKKVIAEMTPHCDKIITDYTGNVVCVLNPDAPFKVMLAAHIDEIGLIVTHIQPDGLLRVSKSGGIFPGVYPGHQVAVHGYAQTVYGAVVRSKDMDKADLKVDELYIDIGAKDAAEVAFQLDIPFEVVNYTEDFREKVIEKFIATYEAGGTPNPCIDCNRTMKFDKMLDFARAHGLDYVVTGHYARIEQDPETGRWLLKKALYTDKDQSYVLYALTQDQLAHTKFPLGGMDKPSIRKIAEEQGFCNARKHDSQDICFVPDGDYARFMEDFTGKRYPAGDFLDENGRVVGTHNGAVRYTIGQRKGLGLARHRRGCRRGPARGKEKIRHHEWANHLRYAAHAPPKLATTRRASRCLQE